MNPFTYVGNVLSGRIRHWNEHHNQTFTQHWNRADQLDTRDKAVAHNFLRSTLFMMEQLVGPDQGDSRIINTDPMKLQANQFSDMQMILFRAYARAFAERHPEAEDWMDDLSVRFTGKGLPPRCALDKLSFQTWDDVLAASQVQQFPNPIATYKFSTLFLSSAADISNHIEQELRV